MREIKALPFFDVTSSPRAQIKHASEIFEPLFVTVLVDEYRLDKVIEFPDPNNLRELLKFLPHFLLLVVIEDLLFADKDLHLCIQGDFLYIVVNSFHYLIIF